MAPPSSSEISFTSRADASYHDQLEALFYFHPLQTKYYDQIVAAVEYYGHPVIHEEDGRLSIRLDRTMDAQCLFAFFGPRLAGIAVYTVEDEKLVLIHLAMDAVYSKNLPLFELNLAERFVSEILNRCACRVIRTIVLPYTDREVSAGLFGV